MGRKPKKRSSFMIVVNDYFLNKCRVPQPFLKNFTEIIPKEVFFKRSMKCWIVKLKKIENELYFRKGLKAFIKENHIEQGDYIVFKLVRDSVLNFTIYDQTFCEKERIHRNIIPEVNILKRQAGEKKSAKLQSRKLNIGKDGCGHVNVKGKKLEEAPNDPHNKKWGKCLHFTSIFCQGQAPEFPEWFIEKLEEELKCVVIVNVKVASGDYCDLELTKVDSKIFLKGWKSFVAKHSIRDGQTLKFKYVLPNPDNEYEVDSEEGMDCLVSEEELGTDCRSGAGSKEVFVDGSEEPSGTKKEGGGIYSKPDASGMRFTKSINIRGDEWVNKKHSMKKKSLGMHSAEENVAATASTTKQSSTHFFDFMEDFRKNFYVDEDQRMSIADIDSAPYLDELKRSGTEYTKYLLFYIKELALGMCNEFDSGVSINDRHKAITAEKPRRPLNSYMIFMEEFRKMYMIKNPNSAAKDNGIAGGEKWRSMSSAEKAPYVAEAKKRIAEYNKQREAYRSRAVGSGINDGAELSNLDSEVNENGKKEMTCKEDNGNCYQSKSASKEVSDSISSEEENTDEGSDSYNSISAYDTDDNGEMRDDEDKHINEVTCKEHKAITAEKHSSFYNPYMIFMEKFRKTYMTEYPNSKAKENGIAGGEKWRSMTNAEKAPYVAEAQNRKKYYKRLDSERTMKHGKRKAKRPANKPKQPANQYMVFMEEFWRTYKLKDSKDPSMETAKAGGEKWNSMSNAERAPYVAETKKRRTEYNEKMKAYYREMPGNCDTIDEKMKEYNKDEDEDEEAYDAW